MKYIYTRIDWAIVDPKNDSIVDVSENMRDMELKFRRLQFDHPEYKFQKLETKCESRELESPFNVKGN